MKKQCVGIALFGVFMLVNLATSNDLTVNNGGYEGIVVSIHKSVKEDVKIIDGIKEMFTSGSETLFTATGRRLYFKEVTIVLPETWNGTYNQTPINTDTYSKSHVRIAPANPDFGDTPYTLQPGGCGEPGKYIHFTDKFVSELKGWTWEMFGDAGRQLVHEWSHLRYGVFDEYGSPGDRRFPLFYLDDGKIRPSSCVSDVSGWIEQEGGESCILYENRFVGDECQFIPNLNPDEQMITASLMYLPYLPKVGSFCLGSGDNFNKHNWRAPTKQNIYCKYKSTWEVISSHEEVNKSVVMTSEPPKTSFKILRVENREVRTVLLLDVSSSMSIAGRLTKLQRATNRFIMDIAPLHMSLGLVQFSEKVKTLVEMTSIKTDTVRRALIGKIPKASGGGTSIGLGLRESLNVLSKNDSSTKGAMIILITDGEETSAPYIHEVLSDVEKSGVIVNTIAVGASASHLLESLASKTGGSSFYLSDSDVDASGLDAAFGSSTSSQVDVDLQPISIVGEKTKVELNKPVTKEVFIDKELGKNAEFTFIGQNLNQVKISLKSPSGKIYNENSEEFDSELLNKQRIKIKIPLAETGKWFVTYVANQDASIDVTVTSEVRDPTQQPIRAEAWFDQTEVQFPKAVKVLARVTRGFDLVLEATVIATVLLPNQGTINIILKDNGVGADIMKNDGIYSGYFSDFTGNGRYSAIATVKSDGKAKLKIAGTSKNRPASAAPSKPTKKPKDTLPQAEFELEKFRSVDEPIPDEKFETKPTEDFNRNLNLGSFQLKSFINDPTVKDLPPASVSDLKVDRVSDDEPRTFSLSWTAAGKVMTEGIAKEVKIAASLDGFDLLSDFKNHLLTDIITEMKAGGEKQMAEVKLSPILQRDIEGKINETYDISFALITVSGTSGKEGEVSNIATANIGYSAPPLIISTTVTVKEQELTSTLSSNDLETTTLSSNDLETTTLEPTTQAATAASITDIEDTNSTDISEIEVTNSTDIIDIEDTNSTDFDDFNSTTITPEIITSPEPDKPIADNQKDDKTSLGIYIGVPVGIILFLGLVTGVVCIRKKRLNRGNTTEVELGSSHNAPNRGQNRGSREPGSADKSPNMKF